MAAGYEYGLNIEPPAKSIFEEAEKLVNGDRAKAYGDFKENFRDIGIAWQAILRVPVSAKQVALCMVMLKALRENNNYKRDNWVDLAGYAWLGQKIGEDEESK